MSCIGMTRSWLLGALLAGLSASTLSAQELKTSDLMSFARGTLPLAVSSGEANLRVGIEHAVSAIDGNPSGFVAMQKPAKDGDAVEFLYVLPAPTQFDRFAVPNIRETPSPSQTFFKHIEVSGSAIGADGPFLPLASAELTVHSDDGQLTELVMEAAAPEVSWIKLRLHGGIDVQTDKIFLEFSELVGTGVQQEPALSDNFHGVWSGRGVKLELEQKGAAVTGCYDGNSMLAGTVQGNVLRALGQDPAGIASQFILIAAQDGAMRGLRSTNSAPFRQYDGDASDAAPKCLTQEPPKLGCGSIVHGIGFDFDSDVIRPSSKVVIADLFEGLAQDGGTGIRIVGHSSSEGAADYNRDLSQRRAQSVVAALVALGIDAAEISAGGRGEDDPIASNDDEAGRSLNRRVEVQCAE